MHGNVSFFLQLCVAFEKGFMENLIELYNLIMYVYTECICKRWRDPISSSKLGFPQGLIMTTSRQREQQ